MPGSRIQGEFSPVCSSDQLTFQGDIVLEHRCTIAYARIGPSEAIATMHLVVYFLDLGLALAGLFLVNRTSTVHRQLINAYSAPSRSTLATT
jgi:hypothetical protein